MIRACAGGAKLFAPLEYEQPRGCAPRRPGSSHSPPTKKPPFGRFFAGGDDQTRTDYLYVANVSLYRVSYIPIFMMLYQYSKNKKIFQPFLPLKLKIFSKNFAAEASFPPRLHAA